MLVSTGFAQLNQSYSQTKRGLDYVQASQRLNKARDADGFGVDQPDTFVISGIPQGAVIEKVFLIDRIK